MAIYKNGISQERTGWRDEKLSERHRYWGFNCPMVDIDFLVCEYDDGETVAVIEYKHENATPQYPTHPSYRALIGLSNKAKVPFFAVRYADDLSWYKVTPLNSFAWNHLISQAEMTEKEYVTFLYKLRGRPLPITLFNGDLLVI